MAASVRGLACEFVKGVPAGLRAQVEVWQVPRFNGYGAQKLGRGDSRSTYEPADRKFDSAGGDGAGPGVGGLERAEASLEHAGNEYGVP